MHGTRWVHLKGCHLGNACMLLPHTLQTMEQVCREVFQGMDSKAFLLESRVRIAQLHVASFLWLDAAAPS